MREASSGGLAAVSCTYQWPREYDPNSCALHTDVSSVFQEGWRKAAEDELEYKFRINERHWVFYMTHVVVMQRDA